MWHWAQPTVSPNQAVPVFPETDVVAAGLGLRFRYSDTRSFAYTVGPQEGQSFTASVRVNHPGLGSHFHSLELGYRWEGYYKLPWGETPVLSLRLAGGVTTTDRRRAGGFTLGGVPEQDIPSSILDNARSGGTGYLRGLWHLVVGRRLWGDPTVVPLTR